MQNPKIVKHCYDLTAATYAEKFRDELVHKPVDRMLLAEFARLNQGRGVIADFGCGPGQTTRFLAENGLGPDQLLGIDLSSGMVEAARKLHPALHFETGDLLALDYPDQHFGAAIAFYAIVHFDEDQLATALQEVYRVLKPGGQFLFSFHIGTEIIHHDEFLGKKAPVDFYFFEVGRVMELVAACGFKTISIIERHPHPEVEYPSRRAYVWVERGGF